MKIIPLLGGLWLAIVAPMSAATITAATNSAADVQRAINSSAEGDTVIIPDGAVTWTKGVSIDRRSLRLHPRTMGGLDLTHGAGSASLIDCTTSARGHLEISGIDFLPGTAKGRYVDIHGNDADKAPLLHDCTFNVPNFQLLNAVRVTRRGGVIWNCTFFSLDPNGSGSGCLQLVATSSASSWTTDSTLGAADTTGTSNTYVEDCTFTASINQCIDVDDNIRAVIRHNTFNDSQVTFHGSDTSTFGIRHGEFYDNICVFHSTPAGGYKYPFALNRWIYVRGASGVITDNVLPNISSQDYGNKPEIVLAMQNARRRAGPYPCPSVTSYPVGHQIGRSFGRGALTVDPYYIWNNRGAGMEKPSLEDFDPDECGHELHTSDFVRSDRDFIVGTARPGYTKYVYPHPLRTALATP